VQLAMKSWLLTAILLLSLAGIAVSSVSLYHHYDRSKSSFCDFGGKFNCDIVNRSIYSHVGPVPVALIGILGYVFLAVMSRFCRRRSDGKTFLLISSLVGLGFAFYLTYLEGFVLAAWCVLCLTSLALIFTITILAATFALRANRSI
jgi:uncharacterized membrane protein